MAYDKSTTVMISLAPEVKKQWRIAAAEAGHASLSAFVKAAVAAASVPAPTPAAPVRVLSEGKQKLKEAIDAWTNEPVQVTRDPDQEDNTPPIRPGETQEAYQARLLSYYPK